MILCFQSPALAPQSHSHLRNQRNRRSSHTYRFPAGTLRKNRLFPRLMLPWKGKTTMEGPHEVQGGLSKPHGAPTRLLSMSRCVPAQASFSTYLPVQLAPAIQPGRVGGCVRKETPGQPGEGRKDPPGMIPCGNHSHLWRWDQFPPWLHTGLNPKMTFSHFSQGGINPVECWKHPFHLGILEKWFQKLIRGWRTQVSVGLGTHPQLFTAIRLETRTKGYVSMLAKNCKKSGDRWDVPSSLHTGRTPGSYTPGRESTPATSTGSHVSSMEHPLACGLIRLIPAWPRPHPVSRRIPETHHSLGKGSTSRLWLYSPQ